MSFEIAPFRALRYGGDRVEEARGGPEHLSSLVAPPYDVISPKEHRALLDRSPHNIVRLTLGDGPGERAGYGERAALLSGWREEGVLVEDSRPALHVYGVDYLVPGRSDKRMAFRGLLALGSLHPFENRVVQPHEKTFEGVVDDRYRLLEATRTHLELILLLYSDPEKEIDRILLDASREEPGVAVEARPGERHMLWVIREGEAMARLAALLSAQRPIIADGHHRYTTACLYRKNQSRPVPGTGWQPVVLGNLFGDGLSILATHRLVSVGGRAEEALRILEEKLRGSAGEGFDFEVETRNNKQRFRIPESIRSARRGAAATSYAILHELVLGEWLRPLLDPAAGENAGAQPVQYFKEGTGEREALESGKGDLLFRMEPVGREEFQKVVEGGEVFPHKTTFFYPKLLSGLVLWAMEEPASALAQSAHRKR